MANIHKYNSNNDKNDSSFKLRFIVFVSWY